MSDVDGASEKEAKVISGSLAPVGNVPTVNQIIEEATQTDVTTSNVKTYSPLEITNGNVIEIGVDHIVAGDEKQSQTYNSEEDFSAAAPTDSDEIEPSPNKISSITGSVITSSVPATQETADDNVGAVLENNDSDTSLSGQIGTFSPEGSLNAGTKRQGSTATSTSLFL